MHLADVLIHIDPSLADESRTIVENELRQVDGVIAPRFDRAHPHLLLVSYDPQATTAHSLLGVVQRHGYSAQLIGL